MVPGQVQEEGEVIAAPVAGGASEAHGRRRRRRTRRRLPPSQGEDELSRKDNDGGPSPAATEADGSGAVSWP